MVDTNTAITNVNQQIVSSITSVDWLNILGWIALITLLIGGGIWYVKYSKDKRIYNRRITAFELINGEWKPAIRDLARIIKLGKGGFEILYLKKSKTWKISYGGRVGKDDYYYFIQPDGYWYNGYLGGNLMWIDKNKGMIPVMTANPLMRGQYTALEKQIDALSGEKNKFWDRYGSWILSVGFILIAGVMLWLSYKEFANVASSLSGAIDRVGILTDKMSNLATNLQSASSAPSGLIPA